MRPKRASLSDRLLGYAFVLIIAAIAMMFLAILDAQLADAGQVCRSCAIKQPVIAQQVVAAPVYYAVGQSLQQEATATQSFRQSDEYIELQQLRGYRAGVEAVTSSVAGSSSPPPAAPGEVPAGEGQTNPPAEPAEVPPAAPPVSDFAGRYPVLAAKCSRCHTGDEPKGDFWIDGTTSLQGPDAAPKRDAIAAAIINGRMPKGKPLTDQEQFDAVVQLFTE